MPSQPTLVEGEDYYVEKGRYVFTRRYHEKRGYCCKSGCRHCPWREKPNAGNSAAAPADEKAT
ncbi:MAG: DUF5522 domain-containing protein [Saprospiraceae bacterium]|jgi:hypothetical protein